MTSEIIASIRKLFFTLILLILLIWKWPHLTMVFITFSAVMVALFKEDIYSFYKPPVLTINVPKSLDRFDEVEARDVNTGAFVEKQTYFVIIVENTGIGVAQNLEVYFNGLESNVVTNFGRYKYVPLVTSWTLQPHVRYLPPKVGIRFTVCHIRKSCPNEISFISLRTPNALHKIKCTPGKGSSFRFEVVAFSDNSKLSSRKIEIEFMGNYLEGFKIRSY